MPEVGVILILTGSEGQEVWHKMLRAGIKEFVTRPLTADRLLEEVRKVATIQSKASKRAGSAPPAPAVAQPEAPKHRVVTITGPRGGCGKTVIATNLAVALARASEKVALVDLNLWGGDVAMLLDVTPQTHARRPAARLRRHRLRCRGQRHVETLRPACRSWPRR